MNVQWPAAFERGDARTFLEEFEDIAELTGIRTDKGSLTGELRRFKTAQLGLGVDALSHAVSLHTMLDRVLPTFNKAAHSELLLDHFTESLLDNIREKARMVDVGRAMGVFTLAAVVV
ncbi:unnamed protein product [Echinostoma caproni]|uniref:Zinc finger, CCHC-type, retrotransposon Gag domain protein n=1 Tax=Echinostoma caproni TaxID=27848 RepID=A0A183ABV0_9TREM|nr:unnamed protein product [Echinostoma caproni]